MAEKIFPYELPESWQWVKLVGDFAECLDNFRSPINASERAKRIGNVPYYGATGQIGWIDDFLTDEQLVLLGEDGAPFLDSFKNKAYIIEGKAWVNNHAHILRSYFGNAGNKFMKYYLNNFDFADYVTGTTRLKLTQSKMKEILIPLPPIDEQKKIVERIESLFTKLDAAKSIVQKILDGYELRRSAILHKAFTGELSKNFRAENNLSLDYWQEKTLSEVLFPMKKKLPIGEFFQYIDIDAIDNKNQVVKSPKIIKTKGAPSRASRAVETQNILFSMVRPYLKNIALVEENLKDCIASTGFYVCRCKEKIFPKFLYRFLCSDDAINYLMQFMKGDNSPSIRKSEFLSLSINLPSLAEQKKIVRVLDSLLDKEQRTQEIAEKILQEIDLLKKSILVRAFRGELTLLSGVRKNFCK